MSGIRFPDVQTDRVTISWNEPADSRVTNCSVTALRGGTEEEGSICDGSPSGNTTSRNICNLRAGSSYTFNVNAISGGESGEVESASQTLGK